MSLRIHGHWQFPKGSLVVLCCPSAYLSSRYIHMKIVFRMFSYFILQPEGKMLKTELHVFLTAQNVLEHGSPLMMFMPCSTNGSCDPKEANLIIFLVRYKCVCQLVASTLHKLGQLIAMKELKTTLDIFPRHMFGTLMRTMSQQTLGKCVWWSKL